MKQLLDQRTGLVGAGGHHQAIRDWELSVPAWPGPARPTHHPSREGWGTGGWTNCSQGPTTNDLTCSEASIKPPKDRFREFPGWRHGNVWRAAPHPAPPTSLGHPFHLTATCISFAINQKSSRMLLWLLSLSSKLTEPREGVLRTSNVQSLGQKPRW